MREGLIMVTSEVLRVGSFCALTLERIQVSGTESALSCESIRSRGFSVVLDLSYALVKMSGMAMAMMASRSGCETLILPVLVG